MSIEFPSKDDGSLPTEYRRFASSHTNATALSFNLDESLLAVGVSRWGQSGILDPGFSPPPVLRDPVPIPNLVIDTRKMEAVAHWPEGYRHVQRAAKKDWWLASNPGLAIYDAKNTQLIRRCNEEFAKPLIATWLGETDQIIAIDNQKRILVLNSELSDCKEIAKSELTSHPLYLGTDSEAKHIVACDREQLVVYELRGDNKSAKLLFSWSTPKGYVFTAVTCSGDGRCVAAGIAKAKEHWWSGRDAKLMVWRLPDGKLLNVNP